MWWFINIPPLKILKLFYVSINALIKSGLAKSNLRVISKKELLLKKKTKRIFIYGSGYSLNKISDKEWRKIKKYDSLGFNGSFHLKKIDFSYHILRAGYETVDGIFNWKAYANYALSIINGNFHMDKTIFLFPRGIASSFTNNIIGNNLWPKHKPIFFYNTDRVGTKPHQNVLLGLPQRAGTLCMAISFAVSMKYEEIVMIGVDLYDNQYFWVPKNKTLNWSSKEEREIISDLTVRGISAKDKHNTVNNGVVEIVQNWADYLYRTHKVRLTVYNKKSLLAGPVEVFRWHRD
ncbi:hypothetical protein [Candidatus Methylopumilus universalis]|uniref:hypothetical protein n=1 Tax=Candidatus Methylopumilus universalis TaxID=2588536 RepID=UPI003BEECDD7